VLTKESLGSFVFHPFFSAFFTLIEFPNPDSSTIIPYASPNSLEKLQRPRPVEISRLQRRNSGMAKNKVVVRAKKLHWKDYVEQIAKTKM
jgi:hypothetical protein